MAIFDQSTLKQPQTWIAFGGGVVATLLVLFVMNFFGGPSEDAIEETLERNGGNARISDLECSRIRGGRYACFFEDDGDETGGCFQRAGSVWIRSSC